MNGSLVQNAELICGVRVGESGQPIKIAPPPTLCMYNTVQGSRVTSRGGRYKRIYHLCVQPPCMCISAGVQVLGGVLGRLTRCEVLYHSSPERMSKYQLLQARDQFRAAGPPSGVVVRLCFK